MITRDQLKAEIDAVDSNNIETLHHIIQALGTEVNNFGKQISNDQNPLKGSVTFEKDIISPIDMHWDAAS